MNSDLKTFINPIKVSGAEIKVGDIFILNEHFQAKVKSIKSLYPKDSEIIINFELGSENNLPIIINGNESYSIRPC